MQKQSKTGQTISKKYAFIACQTQKQVARHVWMSVSFHNKTTVMLQCVLDNLPNKKKERCNFCKNPPSVGSICAFRGSHKLGQSMKGSLRFHLRNALFITGSPPHPDMEGINTGPRWTTEIPPVLLCLGGWLSLPNENKHSQHSSPFSNQPSGLVSKALHHYGNKKRKRDEC